MRDGESSKTAALVCMGRAIAHGNTPVARYSDPTALAFLSDDERARVDRVRRGEMPKELRARFDFGHLQTMSELMVARTVAIDDVVRAAAAPQLVILGAGLDGRAWRMPELANTVVFEIDHPDTQREKRAKVASLTQTAREVRFAPVDFVKDSLDKALADAGHDPTKPTTWIWEGVVMYLALPAIEATLDVVEKRSAPGSRLAVMYHARSWMLAVVGFGVRLLGEPLRSRFSPAQMKALLARHHLDVTDDRDIPTIAADVGVTGERMRYVKHGRLAFATRR